MADLLSLRSIYVDRASDNGEGMTFDGTATFRVSCGNQTLDLHMPFANESTLDSAVQATLGLTAGLGQALSAAAEQMLEELSHDR